MAENLKTKIKEFSEIAKSCPENLQESCFKILLQDYLDNRKQPAAPIIEKANTKNIADPPDDNAPSQEDFVNSDLHVRTRKFLTDNNLTLDQINQIFYKEGDKVEPLFDDLKTTKLAESQIRIALLQALRNAIHTGNFEFSGESVRDETELRKCYDSSNFSANFKNSKSFFEGFEKYDKQSPAIKLNKSGREELATVVRDLQ